MCMANVRDTLCRQCEWEKKTLSTFDKYRSRPPTVNTEAITTATRIKYNESTSWKRRNGNCFVVCNLFTQTHILTYTQVFHTSKESKKTIRDPFIQKTTTLGTSEIVYLIPKGTLTHAHILTSVNILLELQNDRKQRTTPYIKHATLDVVEHMLRFHFCCNDPVWTRIFCFIWLQLELMLLFRQHLLPSITWNQNKN